MIKINFKIKIKQLVKSKFIYTSTSRLFEQRTFQYDSGVCGG